MGTATVESVLVLLTQFGAAGLIGVLWMLERRTAMQRDRQLQEAHDRILSQRRETESLLQVVKDNTAAMKSMEYAQRRLIEALKQLEHTNRASAA